MATSPSKPSDHESPYDRYVSEQKSWMEANPEVKGYTLIKSVEDYIDEDDGERVYPDSFTTEEVNSMRMIMMTENREKETELMQSELLGDQNDLFLVSFNTSFSNVVFNAWTRVKRRLLRKTPAQKLDILISFTTLLREFDFWMNDNEGGMDTMVKGLASAWKRLLKNDDKALGWDLKYTKPGVMELLESFKKVIEDCPSYCELGKFKYM